MRKRLSTLVTLELVVAFVGSLGCSDDSTTKSKGPDGGLEVFSWWTSGGEQEAFNALVTEFNKTYPDVTVINAAQKDPDEARTLFEARMSAGDPPDTFQSVAGNAVAQWVGKTASQTKIVNLNELAIQRGFKSAFKEDMLRSVSIDGSLYAVPLNVHRINTVLFSPPLFKAQGLTQPATIAELKSVALALKAKGIPAFALGVKEGWTASLWIVDGLFLGLAGADHTRAFLRGELTADDPKLNEAIDLAKELIDCSNQDREDLEWNQAAALVSSGKAAMNPMGDWAYAELKVRGAKLGVDFDVMVHPGTQGTYLFNSDTFPITVGAKNPRAAEAWIDVVASERGQNAFNLIKGSIPARSISDTSAYDDYAKRSLSEFGANDTQRVLALSAIVPVAFERDMNVQMQKFVLTGDTTALRAWFKENYSRLSLR